MNFKCECCNYETDDKSNFNKHVKSSRHLQKRITVVEDIPDDTRQPSDDRIQELPSKNTCENCGRNFSHSSGYYRHKKYRCDKVNDTVIELKKQLLEYQASVSAALKAKETKETENKYLKRELEIYKKIVKTGKRGDTYNISVKNYVQQRYPNAPALKGLPDYAQLRYEGIGDNNSDDKPKPNKDTKDNKDKKMNEVDDFVDTLVYHYDNGIIHKYLGDFIVKYYKKDDPAQQSIWSSDTSRLTYVIKELLANNESTWHHDYKGIKTNNYIINPILKYIKIYINEYWMNHLDNFKTKNLNQINKFNHIYRTIYKIKKDMETGTLGNSIIRYIAPHFYMPTKEINGIDTVDYFIDTEEDEEDENIE